MVLPIVGTRSRDMPTLDTKAGAAVYSRAALSVYDFWVLGFSNRFVWRCSADRQLAFFREHAGQRHLDVGVGTGYYPAHAGWSSDRTITFLDLNRNSLEAAARRVQPVSAILREADVMQPLSFSAGVEFDSISLFFLLHCLPGRMADKARAIANLAPLVAKDGVLYGSTILGPSAEHNAFGRLLLKVYNDKGIFGNASDTRQELEDALRASFDDVVVRQEGVVALFTARKPRRMVRE
ncbi:class I SAM-dependent methyltransferase [Pendulispora albinea]|uniref:Class I SAM-dependent methyltransferase n=1 Tax=Pendulispora albinea TaxID=2741071 RepID=A0ABZ2M0Z0_9BACT